MNHVTLIGRLTADPELKTTQQNGTPVCTFRIAVSRVRGRGGEDRGAAYFDVETWGNQAHNVANYLSKGRAVAVSGRLEQQEWTNGDGARRQRVYVIADEPRGVEFIDSRTREDAPSTTEPAAA